MGPIVAVLSSTYLLGFGYCIYKILEMDVVGEIDKQLMLDYGDEMRHYIYDLMTNEI